MKQEDKKLLLTDLCTRLAYGVKCTTKSMWNGIYTIVGYKDNRFFLDCPIHNEGDDEWMIESIVPYLRPMSSMTEEECLELSKLKPIYDEVAAWKYIKTPVPLAIANIKQFDFFHSHHLDWRDLIPKGLALEAPKDMYKEE